MADLAPESRSARELAMAEAGFVFEVTRVKEVEEEVDPPRCWPRALPGGGFLIRDVAGDLYRLPEPEAMDKVSRELLWAFVG